METESVSVETSAPVAEAPAAEVSATPAETAAPPPLVADPVADAAPEEVTNRYERSLEALMAKARDTRRQQETEKQQQAQIDFARRIAEAQQYGPDAVKRVLGIEEKKFDLKDILGEEDDGEPKSVKQLKKEMEEIKAALAREQQGAQQKAQQEQQARYSEWEKAELSKIETFLGSSKEKYEYAAELAPIGSTRDLYNGIINMYQAGYTPSYEDMAELVENRVEDILDRLSKTKKFHAWAAKRLKPQSPAPTQSSPTLTGALNSDGVAPAPTDDETDEQNRRRALQAALAVREAALRTAKK